MLLKDPVHAVLSLYSAFSSAGKNIDGVLADPFMMIIPPIEQFSHEYIFATPDDERVKKEFDNYVTLVVQTKEKAGKTI